LALVDRSNQRVLLHVGRALAHADPVQARKDLRIERWAFPAKLPRALDERTRLPTNHSLGVACALRGEKGAHGWMSPLALSLNRHFLPFGTARSRDESRN